MNKVNVFLKNHNRQQSEIFRSPDEVARRELYKALHPTLLKVNKCMDGRVNVPTMTDGEVPLGVISPFRNMGGRFKIGSPSYAHYVRNFYEYTLREMKGGSCPGGLVIVTYHYSAGDPHRGCLGFNYDTETAQSYTAGLACDFNRVYGSKHQVVHTLQVGIETDREAFIFHGDTLDTTLNISDTLGWSIVKLHAGMRKLYPEMREEIFNDLMPFAIGNQRHVQKIVGSNRPPNDLNHSEQVIAVGRGFDWLHVINKALIVGPFSVDWPSEVVAAARIVLLNLKEGRAPKEEGAVLLVCAPYRHLGVDAEVTAEKAREMARVSWRVIKEQVPELLSYDLELIVGALDRNTMLLQYIEISPEDLQTI